MHLTHCSPWCACSEHPTGLIKYHNCGIPDTPDADLSVAGRSSCGFIDAALTADEQACVLVHCASGVSRSVAVVLYFLMSKQGMSLLDAIDKIRRVHPAALPNEGFLSQLKAFENLLVAAKSGPAAGLRAPSTHTPPKQAMADDAGAFLRRASSWSRVLSVESVGWMTRSSYPADPKGGWMKRIPSVPDPDSAPKRVSCEEEVVVTDEVSQVLAAVVEEVEREAGEDGKADEDSDAKSMASTSLALSEPASESSELSEGEEGQSPRGCSSSRNTNIEEGFQTASQRNAPGGVERVCSLPFWHQAGVLLG